MEKSHLALIAVIGCVFLVGCTNYYETEEGMFCVDSNKDEVCDKDAPVELDTDNLYEFETGVFCADANNNQVCDKDESTADSTTDDTTEVDTTVDDTTTDNTTTDEVTTNAVDEITEPESTKSTHEQCLDSWGIKTGSMIYRYADWDPFLDDTDVDTLEDAGFDVYRDVIGTDVSETYDVSDAIAECFDGVYTVKDFLPPEYICANDQSVLSNGVPGYNDLREFANDCKRGDIL